MSELTSKIRKYESPTFFAKLFTDTKKKLRFRPFLAGEQKNLLIAQETGGEEVVFEAIKSVTEACVLDPINFEDLVTYDAENLFLQIRSKAVGESVQTRLKCPVCEKTTLARLQLGDVELSGPMNNEPIQISDGRFFKFSHPKMKSLRLSFDSEQPIHIQDYVRFADCLESIQDNDLLLLKGKDFETVDAIELLDSLSVKDYDKIQEFFNDVPYLQLKTVLTCPHCKSVTPEILSGIQDFFD